MSAIKDWSTTAASNNSASPDGFPEGMAPSGLNDSAREVMAQIRAFYETLEWRDWGHTVTYGSGTTFTTAAGDGDTTSVYLVGRRIKAVGSSTGTIYGTITASSHSTTTTVTIEWDSGSLQSEALTITVGLSPTGSAVNPSGWAFVESKAAASAAAVDFTSLGSDYDYQVVYDEVAPSVGNSGYLIVQIMTAVPISDASYYWAVMGWQGGSTGGTTSNNSEVLGATNVFPAGWHATSASALGMSGTCEIYNLATSGQRTVWESRGYAVWSSTGSGANHICNGQRGDTNAATGLRFSLSTGSSYQGNFRLYRRKRSV